MGCRVEIDCIHAKLSLNGLPNDDEDKSQPKFDNNWFGKNVNSEKFTGSPLILDILLQNAKFEQTASDWQSSDDLKQIRKEQGDRSKDFCIFKTFSAQSFNVTLMPHSQRINRTKKKKKSKKQKFKSSAV